MKKLFLAALFAACAVASLAAQTGGGALPRQGIGVYFPSTGN
jgi:hypothetical protein